MNPYHEIRLHPTRRDLVGFGLVVLGGAGAIGAVQYFFLHHPSTAVVTWLVGSAIFLLSAVPPVGRLLYIGWMGLGVTLGLVTTPIFLGLLYLGIVTPVGLVLRAVGRDPLKRRARRDVASYWENCSSPKDVRSFFKQY